MMKKKATRPAEKSNNPVTSRNRVDKPIARTTNENSNMYYQTPDNSEITLKISLFLFCSKVYLSCPTRFFEILARS